MAQDIFRNSVFSRKLAIYLYGELQTYDQTSLCESFMIWDYGKCVVHISAEAGAGGEQGRGAGGGAGGGGGGEGSRRRTRTMRSIGRRSSILKNEKQGQQGKRPQTALNSANQITF